MADDAIDVQALARDVRYLRDRLDILDCVSRYCRGLDRNDPDLLNAVYHPGAIDRHGPFLGTREEFVPWATELMRGFPGSHHSLTTHICEIDGDVAHAESYCVFFTVMPEGKPLGCGAARYIDALERRDGRWAIATRVEVIDCIYEVAGSEWLAPEWTEIKAAADRSDYCYARPLRAPRPKQSYAG